MLKGTLLILSDTRCFAEHSLSIYHKYHSKMRFFSSSWVFRTPTATLHILILRLILNNFSTLFGSSYAALDLCFLDILSVNREKLVLNDKQNCRSIVYTGSGKKQAIHWAEILKDIMDLCNVNKFWIFWGIQVIYMIRETSLLLPLPLFEVSKLFVIFSPSSSKPSLWLKIIRLTNWKQLNFGSIDLLGARNSVNHQRVITKKMLETFISQKNFVSSTLFVFLEVFGIEIFLIWGHNMGALPWRKIVSPHITKKFCRDLSVFLKDSGIQTCYA